MRRAILHIGTEKTGTTTLQEFLHINRELLSKTGAACLKSPGLRNDRNLATYCMDDEQLDDSVKKLGITDAVARNKWRTSFKSKFDQEINALPERITTVIISSEHFHSRLRSEREIRRLFDLLKDHFSKIMVLVYLRRQDEVAISLYSTMCRTGGTRDRIFPPNIQEGNHYYNYYNLLNKWSNIFGKQNIVPRIFEKKSLVNGDLISDFIDCAAVIKNEDEFLRPKNKNEALSAKAQEVLRCLNTRFPSNKNNKMMRNIFISELQKIFPGPPSRPSRNEAKKFLGIFSESNERLAQEWFKGSLFSNDFSKYPEQSPPGVAASELIEGILLVMDKFLSMHFEIRKDGPISRININGDKGVIFRDLALVFENISPAVAYFLMTEAKKLRPSGRLINKKLLELKEKMG